MEETKKISKELFFCYEKQIGAEKNKIMQVKSADGNIININWDLKEEDYTEESIQVCNFIIEIACACRGSETPSIEGGAAKE